MTPLTRKLAAPLATVALLSTVAGCGSSSSDTSSSSSSGGLKGMPGGAMQTFTAVELNTDGQNATGANTTAVVNAAQAFLKALPAATRAKVAYAFSDNQSRQTWSNYPAQPVLRTGTATLGAMLSSGWLAERTGLLTSNPLQPAA